MNNKLKKLPKISIKTRSFSFPKSLNNILIKNPSKENIQKFNNKNNNSSFINSSLNYFSLGLYYSSLVNAYKIIKNDSKNFQGHYLIILNYLKLFEIEKCEKYFNQNKIYLNENEINNLQSLINSTKKEIENNCLKYNYYNDYINFIKEIYKNNVYFPKIEIKFYSNENRFIVAKENIKESEIILTIPKNIIITFETAKNYYLKNKKLLDLIKEFKHPKHTLISLFILENLNNEKYKFYFDFMPKNFNIFPIFYKKEELEYLKGSNFYEEILNKKNDLIFDYEKIKKINININFDKFCEIHMLISSRIFGIEVENKNTDAMIPFGDLFNHSSERNTQWYFDDNLNCFVVEAIKNIEKNEEIFDSYGNKSNSRFLLNYGFLLENNEKFNELKLEIDFDKNIISNYDDKLNILNKVPNKKGFYNFILKFDLSNLNDLLSFIRIMFYENEMNLFYLLLEKGRKINKNYFPFVDKNLEIKILKYLLNLLKEKLNSYKIIINEKNNILNENNYNMKNIFNIIPNEQNIIKQYIFFCEYCLELYEMDEMELMKKYVEDFYEKECKFSDYIENVLLNLI